MAVNLGYLEEKSKNLSEEGNKLLNVHPINEDLLKQFISDCNQWVNECCQMYKDNLPEEYARQFSESFKIVDAYNVPSLPGQVQSVLTKIKQIHSNIKTKIGSLKDYLEMIRVA